MKNFLFLAIAAFFVGIPFVISGKNFWEFFIATDWIGKIAYILSSIVLGLLIEGVFKKYMEGK